MRKFMLNQSNVYRGNLILVNADNLLKYKVLEDSLESFNNEFSDILINKEANSKLQEVLREIGSEDLIVPVSGFRTLEEQEKIIEDSVRDNGIEFTNKYVAKKNASEHQIGLAIDLGLNQDVIDFIRPSFPRNGICNKFRDVSVNYGFVERYMLDKEDITNISAEEWHFRYVGYPHSKIMKEYNFCLEEYINFLKSSSFKYENYEITFIPYEGVNKEIVLEDNEEISGNNIDGFIITKEVK